MNSTKKGASLEGKGIKKKGKKKEKKISLHRNIRQRNIFSIESERSSQEKNIFVGLQILRAFYD